MLSFSNLTCIYRLQATGLLTLARLVQGGSVSLDRSLLTALVDRWRPETHTFHLPCGEMAPTLQDVAYLLGLPLDCDTIGTCEVPPSWKDDLEARFAPVQRLEVLGPLLPHPRAGGLAKRWLIQFQVRNLI